MTSRILRTHTYKDNLILEYADGEFIATTLDYDGQIISESYNNLDAAKKWIDLNYRSKDN